MEGRQEDAIEGALGVRAVAVVEEPEDALLALFVVSSALDLELLKRELLLKPFGAGSAVELAYVHSLRVPRVEAWVLQDAGT